MHLSLAGVAVAVVAVFLAYFMGYSSGVASGRDEGFSNGKREGSREGSIRAYAVGFDRGKRARDDDEDEDEDEDNDDERGKSSVGLAMLAVAAGVFGIFWLSSHTPTTPEESRGDSTMLPVVDPNNISGLIGPNSDRSEMGDLARDQVQPASSPFRKTVVLPKLNRALPSATPLPSKTSPELLRGENEVPPRGERQHGGDAFRQPSLPAYPTPPETNREQREFPHPPPAFRSP